MFIEVLPLRAIIFQCLFLLIAIAVEGLVFYRLLSLDYKTSMQYSATVNLLSTFVGWLVFFVFTPLLPRELRLQLISYVFFERFLSGAWFVSLPPVLILLGLLVFAGIYLVELQGLELLEIVLGKNADKDKVDVAKIARLQRKQNPTVGFQVNSRAYAVFVGNSASLLVIVVLLFMRLVDQNRITF